MRKTDFTSSEIEMIKKLLRDKNTVSRADKKQVRAKLRQIGFHIKEFSQPGTTFTEYDFDELVRSGVIKVIDGE